MINCILAGVGGQGTVLASKLIAQAAMNKGKNVRTAETIGMAQRGGCVVSHVRIGEEIHSPLIPLKSADIIIGFEPAEAVRSLPYLKAKGTVIVSQKAIKPVTDSLAKTNYDGKEMLDYLERHVEHLISIDVEPIFTACGSTKVLNIALLGAALAAGILDISAEEMEKTIEEKVPQRFREMNLKALRAGAITALKE
ncbi:2-oxoacid:ferredoxin oxidoreductase, gamma subunit [Desulfosporosinus acidiphilus SJ4]|uniref:2-oxoacid:ferredoxin oxidoreductase, gamma subunit n=1 Tax=Desulfosporosinus acidiphilus (strain DSM 22704 / JCM 16185 / SJ4) TaxID=646529 RepID=I4D105_DESAJ|nr:indolepyruvate oxidoreductase subunit beta [Desulfosporosinus acidiphilus]AFM39479.1 2-oxoacid:ferredoxin oxidoreductase, gamma subunit [Desulfosporosinus acidiphilus SJ4]